MTETKTEIPTVEPENEPEYVGAHHEPTHDQCAEYKGEHMEALTRCTNEATHTVVMRGPDGDLAEIPMCDNCGEPQDVQPWFDGV